MQTIVAKVPSGRPKLEEIGERIERLDRDIIDKRARLREVTRELVQAVSGYREVVRRELMEDQNYIGALAGDQAVADLAYIRMMGNGHYRGLSEEWLEIPRHIDRLEAQRVQLADEAEVLRNDARVPIENRTLVAEVEELQKREQKLVNELESVKLLAVDKLMKNVPRVTQVLPHGFSLSNGEFVEHPHALDKDAMQDLFRVIQEIILKSLLGN